MTCQRKDFGTHKALCKAIDVLQINHDREKMRELKVSDNSTMSPKMKNKFVKLIGNKPMVSCVIDGNHCKALWDTGSMISMIDRQWVDTHVPDVEIMSIEEFAGHGGLELKAANNTRVDIHGVVPLNFEIAGAGEIIVPFLVTPSPLKQPVIGYNVIEHVVLNAAESMPEILREAMPSLKSCGNIDAVIALINHKNDIGEYLGDLKVIDRTVIPPNHRVAVKCKTKVMVDVTDTPALFEPYSGGETCELTIRE